MIATSEDYASFYRTTGGWLVIAVGGLLCVGGLFMINRLGRIPTERRILVAGGQT